MTERYAPAALQGRPALQLTLLPSLLPPRLPQQSVLDKADVVLAMDAELAQQGQQAQQAASTGDAGVPDGEAAAEARRALDRSDTGLSAGSTAGADSASAASSLPSGLSSTGRMASTASQEAESLSAALAAAAAADTLSVYVSAAASIQLEPDGDVVVLLEATGKDSVQLSILLPAADAGTEADGDDAGSGSEGGELPPELAGDEVAVVRHMVRLARRQLAKEEAEQVRGGQRRLVGAGVAVGGCWRGGWWVLPVALFLWPNQVADTLPPAL